MVTRIKHGEVYYLAEKKWWQESIFAMFFPTEYEKVTG